MTGLFLSKLKIFSFVFSFISIFSTDFEDVYAQIQDITHPAKSEWIELQKYINLGERPYLKWLNTYDSGISDDGCDYERRAREFNFLGFGFKKTDFLLHQESIGVGKKDKECCVICYASFNSNYHKNIDKMISVLKKVKFKGHFLYRIGGWPDVSGGSLKLIHVPYAFKVCMFKEAKSLGYKRVIWIDTSFKPLKNIDALFKIIKKNGYFVSSLPGYSLRLRSTKNVQEAFGLLDEEMLVAREVASGLIGIDFTHPNGVEIIDRWYKAACMLDPFLSPRPEQSAFGAILCKMNLEPTCSFFDVVALNKSGVKPSHYFCLGY